MTLERVADGLSFPTGIAFDDRATPYVSEAGLPFGGAAPGGRVWRLATSRDLVAKDLRAPVNGLAWHDGALYVAEGGHPARISRIDADGARSTLVEGFPGPGNYHVNAPVVGPDGKLYFSQGAMTNSGVIGPDAHEVAWLGRLPHAHDVPGYDVVLAGVDFAAADAVTGAFVPFGTPTSPGQRVAAGLPASASVMRCNLDGSALELVAWGLRNAFRLRFLPDGRLLAVDQGADDRGSRPVGEAPDLLFEVRPHAWYGWPDFVGGVPVTDARFQPQRGPAPTFLLAGHDDLPQPEHPLLAFPPHTAAVALAVLPPGAPWPGQLVVALFGDERPMTAPSGPRVGRSLVRVDPADWNLHPLLTGPLLRPIDVAVDPAGEWLYVLDFGRFEMTSEGVDAEAGTGALWRVRVGELEAATEAA